MDKVFQIAFMIIMTVGILGLPLYYYLNSRKKRFASEIEEEPENPVGLDLDELEPGEIDTDDRGVDELILDGADYESEEIDFTEKYVYPDSDEEFYDDDNVDGDNDDAAGDDDADNKNISVNSDDDKSDPDEIED